MPKACHLHILRVPAPRERNLKFLAAPVVPDLPEDVALDLDWLNPHFTPTRYVDAAAGPPSALYTRTMAEEAVRRSQEVPRWLTQLLR
jgi:HEPN domain-containing protein